MSAWSEAVDKIHNGENIYSGYVPGETYEWTAWDSFNPVLAREIIARRPRFIVEIGTFLGGSAIHMARLLRDNGIDGAVICIDTWLAESVLWSIPEHRSKLKITYGRPEFYHTFMGNVVASGLKYHIVPLPMASWQGVHFLHALGIRPEIVYHDAEHDRGDVEFCLRRIMTQLKPMCLIVDDYSSAFPGVIHDVDLIHADYGGTLEKHGQKAVITWR